MPELGKLRQGWEPWSSLPVLQHLNTSFQLIARAPGPTCRAIYTIGPSQLTAPWCARRAACWANRSPAAAPSCRQGVNATLHAAETTDTCQGICTAGCTTETGIRSPQVLVARCHACVKLRPSITSWAHETLSNNPSTPNRPRHSRHPGVKLPHTAILGRRPEEVGVERLNHHILHTVTSNAGGSQTEGK